MAALFALVFGRISFDSPVFYPLLDETTLENAQTRETARKLAAGDLGLESMELIAQDELAELYFNPETTELAVVRKATGRVYFSNPQDRVGSTDPLINAQLVVTTLNARDVSKQWNTFDDSVAYGQFSYEKQTDGVRVHYLMGKVVQPTLYPAGMTEARFEELSATAASDKDRSYLKRMYGRVDLTTIKSMQQREDLMADFLLLEEELGGIMYSRKGILSRLEQKNLTTLLENAGYTLEQKELDEQGVGYAAARDGLQNFELEVTYRLDRGSLVAEVDPLKIRATDRLKVSKIGILRNFGALKPGSEGYLFVPDGSGAIMSAKQAVTTLWPEYNRKVYGQDLGILRTDRVDYAEQTYLPVFGAYSQEGGFLGVGEQGDGQMSILAGIANHESAYSTVYPEFTLLSFALVSLESSANNALNLYPREAVLSPLVVRYLFDDSKAPGYDSLAVMYREELTKAGRLDGQVKRPGLPVVVNAVGAIDEIRSIAGYPAKVVKELTSSKEVLQLARQLKDTAPLGDLVIQHAGWQKGGWKSGYVRSVRVEGKLGNAKDMKNLGADLRGMGVAFLPLVEPQYTHQSGWLTGFRPLSHAIRFITGDTGYRPQHNAANFYLQEGGLTPYIVRADLVELNMEAFLKQYEDLGMEGISLGAMASELYSDFSPRQVQSMNDTAQVFTRVLHMAKERAGLVAAEGANAYAVPALDYALSLPLSSSNHPLITRSVPFLQMVLSGSIAYTLPPLNQAADAGQYLLNTLETGSGILFDYFADEGTAIVGTRYDNLYGAMADSIWQTASGLVSVATEAGSPFAGKKIMGHQQLAPGVYETRYGGGHTVIVNYSQTSFHGIEPGGYKILQEEKR